MTCSRSFGSSRIPSPLRIFPSLRLAGGLIALVVSSTFLFFVTGCAPSALPVLPSVAQSPLAEHEMAAGEPILSAGVNPTATTTPTARPQTSRAARPTPKATPLEIDIPTATPSPNLSSQRAIVNADMVNLRSGPGTLYAVLGQATLGQFFRAVGRNRAGDWLEICCPVEPEKTAWISAQFVVLTSEVAALPLAEIPPTPESISAALAANASQSSANPAPSQARPAAGIPGSGGFGPPGALSPLTGFALASDQRSRRPLIVCINNDFAARPQLGTSRADVVYEYLMEGYSITRFSAIYYGESSEQIGPVRSARLINLSLGTLYDAGLVCSGASDPVRFSLKNNVAFPYLDIDLDDPSNRHYTVSIGTDYRTRLRTNIEGLRRWLADWGAERAPSLRGFTFGELPPGGAPASVINIPYPAVTGSQVAYRYDPGSQRYLRFLGGVPHLDGNSSSQLALDTVIVQYVPHETTDIVEDSLGSKSIRLNLFGSGKALIFRNGVGFEGTWRSDSGGDMPRFLDEEGKEIPWKPGHSWISVVPLTYAIAYQ